MTTIEEAKDLATLPLNELIGNLKVYEMILENDGVASKTTTEMVKSLALKAKVTREQTSDDSDSQGGSDADVKSLALKAKVTREQTTDDSHSQKGSDEDVYKEKAEAFNVMARKFCKLFRKGNRFGHGNKFGNYANRFERSCENSCGNKWGESSRD
nr:UBN2 domain-containing protein [Tanacetum cinerariifolium]